MSASHGTVSNSSLQGLRGNLAEVAREDFSYFANVLLNAQLSQDDCYLIQNSLHAQVDTTFWSKSPRSLCNVISRWLTSQGITVLSPIILPNLDYLNWLGLQGDNVSDLCTAELLLCDNGVRITWL